MFIDPTGNFRDSRANGKGNEYGVIIPAGSYKGARPKHNFGKANPKKKAKRKMQRLSRRINRGK